MKKRIMKLFSILLFAALIFVNINFSKDSKDAEHNLLELNKKAVAGCEIIDWIGSNYYVYFIDHCHWFCNSGGYLGCPI